MRSLHMQVQACMHACRDCLMTMHPPSGGCCKRLHCMPPAILADVSCRRHPQSGAEGCASSFSARGSHAWHWQAASYRHQIQRYRRNLGQKGAPVASQTEAAMLGIAKLPLTDTRYSATGSYEVLQTLYIPLFCMAASQRSCKPSSASSFSLDVSQIQPPLELRERYLVQDFGSVDVANAGHRLLVHEKQPDRRLAFVHALPQKFFVCILSERVGTQVSTLLRIQFCMPQSSPPQDSCCSHLTPSRSAGMQSDENSQRTEAFISASGPRQARAMRAYCIRRTLHPRLLWPAITQCVACIKTNL